MKLATIAFLFVALLPVSAQTAFKTYTDPNKQFTVDFPGDPAVSQPKQSDGKQKYMETHLTANDDQTYVLLVAEYETDQANADLEAMAVSEAGACGGGYRIEDNDQWEGHKATLVSMICPEIETRPETYIMVHIVVSGNRIYQVMVAINEKQAKAAPNVAERGVTFLKSLHVK